MTNEKRKKLIGTDAVILTAASLALFVSGCGTEAPVVQPSAQNTKQRESFSDNHATKNYLTDNHALEGETTTVISGDQGEIVLSQGTVLSPDGAACANALVTLDQSFDETSRRSLFTRSDNEGNYLIRGNVRSCGSNMVWAATEHGQLGMSWNSDDTVTIRLQGGSTVVYVRAGDCTPVENAEVTVYQGSIDDISEVVPPNLRKYFKRKADHDGKVEFPSTLGYHDIGFEVRASGYHTMMRGGHSSSDINLFVMDPSAEAEVNCADALRDELFADAKDHRRVNVGYLGSLPAYLGGSNRNTSQ